MSDAIQTSVTTVPALGQPGMRYDHGSVSQGDVVSKVATVDIPFGSFVTFVGETCKIGTVTGDISGKPGGFALIAPTTPGGVGYKAGDIVSVLRKGRVWILSETALAVHAQPFVRTAGTGTAGALGNTADSANATLAPSTTMFTGTAGAGLAVAEINLP